MTSVDLTSRLTYCKLTHSNEQKLAENKFVYTSLIVIFVREHRSSLKRAPQSPHSTLPDVPSRFTN